MPKSPESSEGEIFAMGIVDKDIRNERRVKKGEGAGGETHAKALPDEGSKGEGKRQLKGAQSVRRDDSLSSLFCLGRGWCGRSVSFPFVVVLPLASFLYTRILIIPAAP